MELSLQTHAATARADSLARLFSPRSIALIGASDRSLWSQTAFDNLRRFAFLGAVYPVNPKGGSIHGLPAAISCREIGERVDAALLMVPEAAMLDALADLSEAGGGGAVVLSSGFAETGHEGVEKQARLAEAARAAGIRLIGPNCLGFANYVDSTPIWTTPLRRPPTAPTLALVSQSGAVANLLQHFAYQQRVAFTHMISTGNEADVDVADVIDYLVAHSEAKAIALFLEGVRNADRFVATTTAAHAAGKTVVVLKIGASEAAAKAAQTHTGSIVGDDRVFDALCHRLGIIRVQSLEELIVTADLVAQFGRIETPGFALMAGSGGLCEIVIDQAERRKIAMPAPSKVTREAMAAVLPAEVSPANPLDVTGAVMQKPEIIANAMKALSAEPEIGLVAYLFDSPQKDDERGSARMLMDSIGKGMAESSKPALMISNTLTAVSGPARQMAEDCGIFYTGAGVNHALTAISYLFRWSQSIVRPAASVPANDEMKDLVGERAVLDYLSSHGVPVVPAVLATSVDEAVKAARDLQCAVVLKIASADIAHKTEVGGVRLNLRDEAAVREGYNAIRSSAAAQVPDARIDGVIVSPMRSGGVELFVGTTLDPQWGPAIAVGLGGVFVELFNDVSLRLLPIDKAEALMMLNELHAAKILDGVRGAAPIDRDAVADAIVAIGDAALALGNRLISLEVNPLLATSAGVEALDGLVSWKDSHVSA